MKKDKSKTRIIDGESECPDCLELKDFCISRDELLEMWSQNLPKKIFNWSDIAIVGSNKETE